MTKPDLDNPKHNVAVYLSKTEDDHIKLNIYSDGSQAGTIIDFHDKLALREKWFVYIIHCKDKRSTKDDREQFYTGKTYDLQKRWKEHVYQQGSAFMRNNNLRPTKMVYWEVFDTESEALKREQEIKKWSHDKKARKGNKFLNGNRDLIENKFSLQHD